MAAYPCSMKTTLAGWRWAVWMMAALVGVAVGAPRANGQVPESVKVEVKADRAASAPGGQGVLIVTCAVKDGFHVYPPGPESDYIQVAMKVDAKGDAKAGPVQWPKATRIMKTAIGTEVEEAPVYEGTITAYVPVLVGNAASGPIDFSIKLSYQACNDKGVCFPPTSTTATAQLQVVTGAPAAIAAGTLLNGFDASAFSVLGTPADTTTATPVQPSNAAATPPGSATRVPAPAASGKGVDFKVFGLNLRVDSSSVLGFAGLLLLSMLGGFILNFTPCVLPVLPLKIMSLQASAQDRARCLFLGVMMAFGVITFWLAIGFLVVGIKAVGAVNEIYRYPWVVLGIGAFIAVMSLGMMGLFTVQLPQAVYNISPKHDSAAGSFGFGVMTAILGTPCFGPFAGAAAGGATGLSKGAALLVFGAIGLGMAMPYLVLAAKPELTKKLPRTGPGSELIKQVMGLLLMAAAAFFVGTAFLGLTAERPYLGKVLHWWFVALFVAMAGIWMVFRTFQISPSAVRRATFGVLAVLLTVGAGYWAVAQTADAKRDAMNTETVWEAYTPATFDKAVAEGKVVVVDFTAEWCINCKVIEAAVLNREDVRSALRSEGVVAMKADLTATSAQGWEKLQSLNEVGIPLLAVFGPGLSQPFKSSAYTPSDVLGQIEAARSRGVAAAN